MSNQTQKDAGQRLPIFRGALVVVLGVVAGLCVIFAMTIVSNMIYGPPADFDFNDKQALTTHIQSVPVLGKLLMLLAYALGGYVGGLVAGLALRRHAWPIVTIGGLITVMSVINTISLPVPFWYAVASVVLPLPLCLLGARVFAKT